MTTTSELQSDARAAFEKRRAEWLAKQPKPEKP